jgi:hypothetical protein
LINSLWGYTVKNKAGAGKWEKMTGKDQFGVWSLGFSIGFDAFKAVKNGGPTPFFHPFDGH